MILFFNDHFIISDLKSLKEEPSQTLFADYKVNDLNPNLWKSYKEYKLKYPNCILTGFGLHPWHISSENFNLEKDLSILESFNKEADFIGELGLDFSKNFYKDKNKLQIKLLEKQIEGKFKKPYLFHVVHAHNEFLQQTKTKNLRGLVHSFSSSYEVAKNYLDHNFLLSFNSHQLSKKNNKLFEIIKQLPLKSILLEQSLNTQNVDYNEILDLHQKTMLSIADIKKIDITTVENQLSENFLNLFVNYVNKTMN
jgi:TatD DNase family protein